MPGAPHETAVDVDLVRLVLDPRGGDRGLYLFSINDQGDLKPLLREGRVVVFSDAAQADSVLKWAERHEGRAFRRIPDPFVLRIGRAIELLESGNVDRTCVILNVINTLDDVLIGLKIAPSKYYKAVLNPLADHLTFSRSFGNYLTKAGVERAEAVRAIEWCLGAVLSRVWWYDET